MTNTAVRFMDNNLLLPATATITYSSELAQFPGLNSADQRRSLLWFTGGNFTVTASNKTIYINDGSNKTVTLTEGDYTYSTLATHIATKLNASSSSWTCAYSTTTGKFTIGRSAGTAILRFTQTSNAAWDMLGYTGVVDTSAGTGLAADERRNHTEEWVKADLIQAQDVSAFMACWSLDLPKPFDGDATLKLQFNNIDQWDTPALEITLVDDENIFDRGIFNFSDDVDMTYRYVRYKFENRTNACGPEGFYHGNIYFGDYRTVTVSNVGPEIDIKSADKSIIQETTNGGEFVKLGVQRREYSSMEMLYLDADERRALQQSIANLGVANCFYFCIDPTTAVTADLDEATFYAKFDREPTLKGKVRDVYTLSFALKEVI